MSLRLRLTLMLGSAFVLLWALAATWMLVDLRGQMMLSLAEHLALGIHQIRHQPAANPRQVPVSAVHVGFNTNRHGPLHEFDRQAKRDLLKPSEAR